MSEESTGFQEEWQSGASETAGKIAKSLTKKVFEGAGEELLGAIAGALTGGLSSIIVGGLFDLFDPPENDNILDYLGDIQDIVKEEITQALQKENLQSYSATVNGVFSDLKTDYANYRQVPQADWNATHCQDMIGYLQNYKGSLDGTDGETTDIIQELSQNYAVSGFPIFIYAANLHLSILQEMATMYYWANTDKYNSFTALAGGDFPSGGTIVATANLHIKALINSWESTISNRRDQISIGTPVSTGVDLWSLEVLDSGQNVATFSIGTDKSLPCTANDYVSLYYFPKVLNDLCQGFGSPDAIADHWTTLTTSPLGQGTKADPDVVFDQGNLDEIVTATNDYFYLDGSKAIVLNPGDRLFSTDRAYYLTIATDGNLTINNFSTGDMFWSTNETISKPGTLTLGTDGNLVLTDGSGSTVWSSGSSGTNYMILDTSGMLHIRNTSDQSLVWCTDKGLLPATFSVDGIVNATTYPDPDNSGGMVGLGYKGIGVQNMYVAGSTDGISWHNGPYEMPATMTTQDAPGITAFTQSMIVLFKGNGNSHIYLNSNNPYGGDFGGLVELDYEQVNTSTTPTGTIIYYNQGIWKFLTVYRGSGNDQGIYTFESDAIDDGSGSMTRTAMTTDVTPAAVVTDEYSTSPITIFKGASASDNDSNSTLWSDATGTVEQIPNGVFTDGRPAAAYVNNTLYVVYLGAGDNKIYYITWDKTNGWASAPTALPDYVKTAMAPTVAYVGGRICVYYKDFTSNSIHVQVIAQ